MKLKSSAILRLSLRLLFLQVPLNYRTLQGPGYLFTLWPWLVGSRNRTARVKAASGFMNAQPVFGSLAAGSLLRRLEDGEAEVGGEQLAEWQHTISGPLGIAGDALIWDLWRPLVFSLATLALLFLPTLEAWKVVAPATVLLYNAPLFGLRAWGLNAGYASGKNVLEKLSNPFLARWKTFAGVGAPMVAGGLLAAGLTTISEFSLVPSLQFGSALLIVWIGQRRQWPLPVSLLVALAVALSLGRLLTPAA